MELHSVTVSGFRRFRAESRLDTNGKLVAILGPNEAGKSSLLDALLLTTNGDAIAESDLTRGVSSQDAGTKPQISLRYFLSAHDLVAADLKGPHWFIVTKHKEGRRTWWIEPPPKRDTDGRAKLSALLQKIRHNRKLWARLRADADDLEQQLSLAQATLGSAEETLSEDEIETISAAYNTLKKLVTETDPKYAVKAVEMAEGLIAEENRLDPHTEKGRILFNRQPKILVFDQEHRNLSAEYQLESVANGASAALVNLAKIARLDLQSLASAHADDNSAKKATLLKAANANLAQKFDENWSQSGVHVQFFCDGDRLQILVEDDNAQFTPLAERSDGLREFIALQCFTTCERVENPILLIDEAEQRLHYDAQADLVQMLAKQNVASKVIYMTHSAGCLPEDLGNGVRLAAYSDEDQSLSIIRNKFWANSESGLTPLLFGMGATSLAFFPVRKALIAEGEGDMLLLPIMLRSVLKTASLGYQVVPGLSRTKEKDFSLLARSGHGVAFIVDGDDGGDALAEQVKNQGFECDDIFRLSLSTGNPCELEDFLEKSLFVEAVNLVIEKYHSNCKPLTQKNVSPSLRMRAVCDYLGIKKKSDFRKIEFAYHVLDLIAKTPDRKIIDQKKIDSLKKIAQKIHDRLFSGRLQGIQS